MSRAMCVHGFNLIFLPVKCVRVTSDHIIRVNFGVGGGALAVEGICLEMVCLLSSECTLVVVRIWEQLHFVATIQFFCK